MSDPNLPDGCGPLPNDDDLCPECREPLEFDGDSDGETQWTTATCINPTCPESPGFNEGDPREER